MVYSRSGSPRGGGAELEVKSIIALFCVEGDVKPELKSVLGVKIWEFQCWFIASVYGRVVVGVDLEDAGADGQQTGGDDDAEGLRRLVLVSRGRADELQVAARRTRARALGTHRDGGFLPQR